MEKTNILINSIKENIENDYSKEITHEYPMSILKESDFDQTYKEALLNANLDKYIYQYLFIKYSDIDYFGKAFKKYSDLPNDVKFHINNHSKFLEPEDKVENFMKRYLEKNLIPSTLLPNFSRALSEDKQLEMIAENKHQLLKINPQYLYPNIKHTIAVYHLLDIEINILAPYAGDIMAILQLMNVKIETYNLYLNNDFDIKNALLSATGLKSLYDSIILMNIENSILDVYHIVKSNISELKQLEFSYD